MIERLVRRERPGRESERAGYFKYRTVCPTLCLSRAVSSSFRAGIWSSGNFAFGQLTIVGRLLTSHVCLCPHSVCRRMTVFFSAGVGCIGYGSMVTEGEWWFLQLQSIDEIEGRAPVPTTPGPFSCRTTTSTVPTRSSNSNISSSRRPPRRAPYSPLFGGPQPRGSGQPTIQPANKPTIQPTSQPANPTDKNPPPRNSAPPRASRVCRTLRMMHQQTSILSRHTFYSFYLHPVDDDEMFNKKTLALTSTMLGGALASRSRTCLIRSISAS